MSNGLRFTSTGLPGVQFVRRPTTHPPENGVTCLVDDGYALGWERRPIPAVFRSGAWTNVSGRALPFVPTFWTVIEDRPDDA